MTRRLAVFVAVGLLGGGTVAKAEDRSFFETLIEKIDQDLERAIADNRRKPPQPVAVTWKKRRLGRVDLGAPLLDLVSRDLDGDSKDELIAVTTTHIAVLRKTGHRKVEEVARVALPDKPAPIRSRAPVGTVEVARDGRILARASDQAEGVIARFDGKQLTIEGSLARWPLCEDGSAELVPGRSQFDDGTVTWEVDDSHRSIDQDFLSASCGHELVDPAGNAIEMFGFVDIDDKLVVRCHSDRGTCAQSEVVYDRVGYAFEIADIDNDGSPEVITTSNKPYAGTSDNVYVRGADKTLYSRGFGGGVVAVTAGDVDADGVREVIAVVRLPGATQVNLWTLN